MTEQVIKQRVLFLGLCSMIGVIFFLSLNPLVSYASQSLPEGVVIGDEAGISASSEGEYYVDLPKVLPGESYEKTITIRSLDIKEPFELGLLVNPKSSKGPIDFNKHVTVTLTIGDKELYKGPLLGNDQFNWTVQPLIIGTCKYGTDQILKARFEVDKSLTTEDYKEDSQLLYHWTFIATKNQPQPSDSSSLPIKENKKGKLPMTGEEIRNLIYKMLSGLLLILIIILLWKKKKDEEDMEDGGKYN